MAIAQIQRLIDQSGGFGAYLVFGGDFADWPATLRSYELFAQYVMPHFQGQLAPPQASYDWIVGTDHTFVEAPRSPPSTSRSPSTPPSAAAPLRPSSATRCRRVARHRPPVSSVCSGWAPPAPATCRR